jgi:hypothetical protein
MYNLTCTGLVLLLPTRVTRTTIYAPKYSAECTLSVTVIDGSLENKTLLLPHSFTANFTPVFKQEEKKHESQKYLNLSTVICIRWWPLLPKQRSMQQRHIYHCSASCPFWLYKETINGPLNSGQRKNKHRSSLIHLSNCTFSLLVGRDSSVGIATRYGLDGPGIESR